ncbi:MAG: hypothetical protein BWY74_02291 [Firmicutes bacterium ADurb.Bin419]|nr:MAG: hypothetical protein BWY74_02291 [Firmicutes bacterium ADurb.Bin419]
MIKQKGTILKFKNNLAIIMTTDCKVVSIIKQPGMYVGLEVLFDLNELVHKKNKIIISSQIIAGVAAIFIILLAFFNPFTNSRVYAYVAVDSITSVEFELDKNNKILRVNYFNDDTSSLLKELDLKHQSVDVAIRKVIKKSNLDESVILISACLKEESNDKSGDKKKNHSEEFDKLIDICRSTAEKDLDEDTQSKVVETPYDYKKLADINKISIGRSIVYEKAKEQGIDMDIEEIKNKSIEEALKKVKIDDVGVVHDVKKVKPKKPDSEPERKEPLKEKKDPIDKKDPKNKTHEKPNPEPKNKFEETLVEPKEIFEETLVEPKEIFEETPSVEPKDKPEGKPGLEQKNKPKETLNSEPKLNKKP